MSGEQLHEFYERLVTAQEGLFDQAKKRNTLLSKHTSDHAAVEEKRTLAIERLSKALESMFGETKGEKP